MADTGSSPRTREATFQTLRIVIEREGADHPYVAYSPSLRGCFVRGRTLEETREAIRARIWLRARELVEQGEPFPQMQKFFLVEDVTIVLAESDRDDARHHSGR